MSFKIFLFLVLIIQSGFIRETNIEPVPLEVNSVQLMASTFLGGTKIDDNYETSLDIDKDGNIFVSGFTSSPDFPVTSDAFSKKFIGGASDRFISSLSKDLRLLNSSTLIGGRGYNLGFIGGDGDEYGHSIALDNQGHVFIAGYTESHDYPVTEHAYDKIHNGGRDVFISKFDKNLTKLLSSTFIGGCGDEGYQWPRIDMKIHDNGDVYITGITHSPDFPVLANSYDNSFNGGQLSGDVFLVKLDNNLTTLKASTFIGGTDDEWRVSVLLNSIGEVIVSGETASADFPVTSDAYDRTFNVMKDIFICKFNNELSELKSSTLFGGSKLDEAIALSIGEDDDIYITGYTESFDFPTTIGVFSDKWNGGTRDAYVAVFNSSLSNLKASTLLGGERVDFGRSIIFNENEVFVTGNTNSRNFPLTGNGYSSQFCGGQSRGDGFISVFDKTLKKLLYSSYFGGNSEDTPCDMVIDSGGKLVITGITSSKDFPITENSFQNKYEGGENDCFITVFDLPFIMQK